MCIPDSLNGITNACIPNMVGLKAVYINDLSNIDASVTTVVDSEVTAMALTASPTTTFKKYEFRKGNGTTYVENLINPQMGQDGSLQTITLVINRRYAEATNEIQLLATAFRNLVVITVDNNNTAWVWGITNGVNVTAETGGADDGMYTVTFVGQEPYKAPVIPQSILNNLI